MKSKQRFKVSDMKKMSKEEFANMVLDRCKKAKKFVELSDLDLSNGHCSMVPMDILKHHDLQFGNGADWARNDGKLGEIFVIERPLDKGKIVGVLLKGYQLRAKKNPRNIPEKVRGYYLAGRRSSPCACCGRTNGKIREIDHRCGRYNEPEFKSENPMHYQLLCKNCNDRKRERCKACEKRGKRFDARLFQGEKLGWHSGSSEYKGTCGGCMIYSFELWRGDYYREDFDVKGLLHAQEVAEHPEDFDSEDTSVSQDASGISTTE